MRKPDGRSVLDAEKAHSGAGFVKVLNSEMRFANRKSGGEKG